MTTRSLLSPDEIMLYFASGKMLVLAQRAHPIITDRVPYWQDSNLKGLWDDPRAPLRPSPVPPPLWGHESTSSPPSSEPPPETEKKQEWWQPSDLFQPYPNMTINNEPKSPPPKK